MKIEIKINSDTLIACNEVLQQLYASGVPPTEGGKLVKSLALDVADKLDAKAKTLIKKATLFDNKKKHKVTLKYHEAWGLYRTLCLQVEQIKNIYKITLINAMIGVLNQKLS